MKIKNIAVLTSGGDAPGMNSAIFGIFSACSAHNVKLYGVISGYNGLIDNNFKEITFDMLDGRINRGGSIIKSSRSPRFLKSNYFNTAIQNLKSNKIDALIIIGGDGSIKGAIKLREHGIKVISIPATIDNDINFSYSIGFDTASNNIVNAIDNISDCLSAFNYGSVVKIMGRDCDDLIDCVSESIHTPFVVKNNNFNLNNLIKDIKKYVSTNNLPVVVLVLEDTVNCEDFAKILQEKCKMQFRAHILGYIQRGGTPSAFDRRYGFTSGKAAVEAILRGESGYAIGMQNSILVKKSFEDTIKKA